MTKLGWLLWKDALGEARGAERVPTLALFCVAVLLTLHFSLPADHPARPEVAAGFLWAAVIFAALLELRRAWETERRDGTLEALRAAPLDPTVLYLAKATSSLVVLSALCLALVPLTALFFGARAAGVMPALGVAVLGCVGLVGWGMLFTAVAGYSRSAEVILPVLLFPLLVPQTIAVVRLMAHYLSGADLQDPITGFVLLGTFNLLSVGTSILLFDYVLSE